MSAVAAPRGPPARRARAPPQPPRASSRRPPGRQPGWLPSSLRRPPPPPGPPNVEDVAADWGVGGEGAAADGGAPPPPPGSGWEPPPGAPGRRPYRRDTPRGPRDEFVRPIVDPFGIGLRLGGDPGFAEGELDDELEANREESLSAGAWAAGVVAVAAVVAFSVGHVVGRPLLVARATADPTLLAPTPSQRADGGRAIAEHEAMLRLEAALGKRPPMSDDALVADSRAEAAALAAEFRDRNEKALVDLATDSAGGAVAFAALARPSEGRAAFFGAFGRIFSGLSDTAKAFLIIASTDVFLGYHSEEGWTAAIHLLTGEGEGGRMKEKREREIKIGPHFFSTLVHPQPQHTPPLSLSPGHYNFEPDERGVALFIATVPVAADACFKLWIFKGLNRANPSAAVTLKQVGGSGGGGG